MCEFLKEMIHVEVLRPDSCTRRGESGRKFKTTNPIEIVRLGRSRELHLVWYSGERREGQS